MMNAKKLGLCVLTAAVLLCGCGKKNDVVTENDVFSCKVDECTIKTEKNELGQKINVLRIGYTIDVDKDGDYKNMSYTVSLNEETKPFLADGNQIFASEKNHVMGMDEAKLSNDPNVTTGFQHINEVVLPRQKKQAVYDNIKSLHIDIQWDGGKQEVELPLTLEESTEKMTEEITE